MTGHDTRLHERCIRSIRFTSIIVVSLHVIRYFPTAAWNQKNRKEEEEEENKKGKQLG
jgi:hypothetical protein